MDRLTVKKIIEINCKKNKLFSKNKVLLEAYKKFIDNLPEYYNMNVSIRLSEFNTPIIIIGFKKFTHKSYPLLYCFGNTYYLITNFETHITSDLEEVLNLIDMHFAD